MKTLGKAAIIFAILFFVFLIPAGILIAIGTKQAASDEQLQETLHGIVDNFNDYGTIHIGSDDGTGIKFSASYTPSGDISGIVLENAAFEVEIDNEGGDGFIVEHTGKYPSALVSRFDVNDGDNYNLDGTSDTECPFFFREENGILTFGLETDYDFDGFSINSFNSKSLTCGTLKVHLPASYKGDFSINNSLGEIEMKNLELGGLNITSAAGEFTAKNCKVEKLTIKSIAGDVEYSGEIGSMEIAEGLGDFEIELSAPLTGDSRITGTVSDVDITVPEGTKLNVNASGNFGNIDIDDGIYDKNGVKFDIDENIGSFSIRIDD